MSALEHRHRLRARSARHHHGRFDEIGDDHDRAGKGMGGCECVSEHGVCLGCAWLFGCSSGASEPEFQLAYGSWRYLASAGRGRALAALSLRRGRLLLLKMLDL